MTELHYDIVGSFLRPAELKKARAEFEEGKIKQEELTHVENKEIRELVQKEIDHDGHDQSRQNAGYHGSASGGEHGQIISLTSVAGGERNHQGMAHVVNRKCKGKKQVITENYPNGLYRGGRLGNSVQENTGNEEQWAGN